MTTAWILLLIAILIACGYALFWAGQQYALRNYMPIPADKYVVPEQFIEHEPITGELELDLLREVTATATIDVIPSMDTLEQLTAERVAADALIVELAEALKVSEKLRDRHWRSGKVARARLNFILGPVLDSPRRPSKQKLAAELIDIGTRDNPARVHVIPPAIINNWKEAAA
jgi:hypothetical protein